MDEAALLSALKSFDTRWSSLEHWLWISTSVVVIGLAFEIVVVFWERRLELFDFWRGTIHPQEFPSKLKFALELLGAGLVTLGVVGELVVGFKAVKVETDMRDATASLVALVDQKAEAAKNDAATLELENTRLLALIQPRFLSRKQQQGIRNALLPFKGRKVIVSWEVPTDTEAYNFASQLVASLGPPLNVFFPPPSNILTGRWYGTATLTGVQLVWPPGQEDLGIKLTWALSKIGRINLLPHGRFVDNMDPVTIKVFPKPFEVLPQRKTVSKPQSKR
jgi:hypothetical protein